jgi:hypothetical protein
MLQLDAFDCQILIITCFVIGCSNIYIEHWVNGLTNNKEVTKNEAIKGTLKTLRSIWSLFAYTGLACMVFTLFYYANQTSLKVDWHFTFGILGTLVSITATIMLYRRIQYLISQIR